MIPAKNPTNFSGGSVKDIKKEQVWIVIPSFNEGTIVFDTVQKVLNAGYNNIVIVDDGSTDGTKEKYEQSLLKNKIFFVRSTKNKGQGSALRLGSFFALLQDAEYIVHFDADGQHDINDVDKIVRQLENNYDIVLGSRFLGSVEGISVLRKFLLKSGCLFVRLLYGIKLTDSQNGLRGMTTEAFNKVLWNADRMEHAGEILDNIMKQKLKYVEVPSTVLYTEYSVNKKGDNNNPLKAAITLSLRMIKHKISGGKK